MNLCDKYFNIKFNHKTLIVILFITGVFLLVGKDVQAANADVQKIEISRTLNGSSSSITVWENGSWVNQWVYHDTGTDISVLVYKTGGTSPYNYRLMNGTFDSDWQSSSVSYQYFGPNGIPSLNSSNCDGNYIAYVDNDWVGFFYVDVVAVSPPDPPSNFQATVQNANSIHLTWNDESFGEEGFRIERSVNSGTYSFLENVGTNVQGTYDNSALPGTTYEYQIRSYDGSLISNWVYSNVVTTPNVNAIPTISLISPSSEIYVTQGDTVTIQWTDSDSDDNAFISLARDPDNNTGNGNHTWLVGTLQEDPDGASDQYQWDTTGVAPGTYNIWAMIYDGVNTEVYDVASGRVTIGNPSMEMELYRVSDTLGILHTSNPGIAKSSFTEGTTVRVTMRSRNNGPSSVGANWVLNLAPSSDHNNILYNSDPTANNTNDKIIPNDGVWYYYSFDWDISPGSPIGSYDLIGSIRDSSDWNNVLDDTELGANTKSFGTNSWLQDILSVEALTMSEEIKYVNFSGLEVAQDATFSVHVVAGSSGEYQLFAYKNSDLVPAFDSTDVVTLSAGQSHPFSIKYSPSGLESFKIIFQLRKEIFGFGTPVDQHEQKVVVDRPSLTDADLTGLEYSTVSSLIQAFTPVLKLHQSERYMPIAVQSILENSTLMKHSLLSNPVIVQNPSVNDLYTYSGSDFYLDMNDNIYDYVNEIYATATKYNNQIFLQYWFPYFFNDWTNNHEGDWEGITIVLDSDDGKPNYAAYSQHDDAVIGGEKRSWEYMPKYAVLNEENKKATNHPVVYVAKGSHASYFEQGETPRILQDFVGVDKHPGDGLWLLPPDSIDYSLPWHAALGLPEILPRGTSINSGNHAWLLFSGRWGDGIVPGYSGPRGPEFRKAGINPVNMWLNPDNWANKTDGTLILDNFKITSFTIEEGPEVVFKVQVQNVNLPSNSSSTPVVYYGFDYDNNGTIDETEDLVEETDVQDHSILHHHDFNGTLPAKVKVYAYEVDEGSGEWFGLDSASIDIVAPVTPTPVNPLDEESVSTLMPIFEWSAFQNGGDGETQLGYQVQVRSDTDEIVYDTGFVADITGNTHEYNPGAFLGYDPVTGISVVAQFLEWDKRYHWHVRYRDSGNNWSAWSADTPATHQDFYTAPPNDLFITKYGFGSGAVDASPGGLSWSGNNGTAVYDFDTLVTLTAVPNSGSTFDSWSGDYESVTGLQCQVRMDSFKSITATFNSNSVTYDATGTWNWTTKNNTVCPGDPNPGSESGTATIVQNGNSFTVTVYDPGGIRQDNSGSVSGSSYIFGYSYAEDGGITTEDITLTLLSSTTATGSGSWIWSDNSSSYTCSGGYDYDTYKTTPHPLSVNKSGGAAASVGSNFSKSLASAAGSGSGTVTVSRGSLNWTGTTAMESYNQDTQVTLTATPDSSSTFTGWSGDCESNPQPNQCQVTMNMAKSVTANFTLNTYTVTPSAGANGSITPNTPQTVGHNNNTQFTVTPDAGYTASVSGTCGGVLNGNIYTTGPITSDCTVDVSFALSDLDEDGYTSDVDCDDNDDTAFPGAPELCDGIDNDCDGVVPVTEVDNDGDGVSECQGDCDDTDINEHPGQTWYKDIDSDGYSDGTTDTASCTRPAGYKTATELTATSGDCNDADSSVNPGAPEIPNNGIDEDCDGSDLTCAGDSWKSSTLGELQKMPVTRRHPFISSVNGKIYVMGGRNENTVELMGLIEVYNPNDDTWATMPSAMPTPRWLGTSCVVYGKIYTIGGNTGSYVNTFEVYDPDNDTWMSSTRGELAPMPTSRGYTSCAVLGDKIYVFGGLQATVEEYDISDDVWTTKTSMLMRNEIPGATVFNNEIYFIGGFNGVSPLDRIAVYNPANDFANSTVYPWRTSDSSSSHHDPSLTSMPTRRYGNSCNTANGKIYVIGGVDSDRVDTVEVYDPVNDMWKTSDPSKHDSANNIFYDPYLTPAPTSRDIYGYVTINDQIYLLGGHDGVNRLDVVEEYSPCDGVSLDTDADGILDDWEMDNFGNLTTVDETTDYDVDGLFDIDEFARSTDPNNPDSDGDGMTDGWEATYSLNPLLNDSSLDPDGDGLTSLQEFLAGTDPNTLTLKVTSIIPYYGREGDSADITNLTGSGFVNGATVKLTKTGEADIVATTAIVDNPTQITCTSDLTGAATGTWDLVVTNPGGESVTLTDSFIIKPCAPTCSIVLTGAISQYGLDICLANLCSENKPVELKVWLDISGQKIKILSIGDNSSFILPVGFNTCFTLIPPSIGLPSGTVCSISLVDPQSGEESSVHTVTVP